MTEKLEISFPNPCSEPWDGMSRAGCHRHCASCDRIVHDLSELDVDAIDALMDREHEVCVRAEIAADGNVRTKDARHSVARRVATTVGMSVTLSLAACQSPSVSAVTPLYSLTGSFPGYGHGDRRITLTRSDGYVIRKRVKPGRSFEIPNLYAGNYELVVETSCSQPLVRKIVITGEGVDAGEMKMASECIIIGVMKRSDATRLG